MACTLDNWDAGSTNIVASQPNGLESTDGTTIAVPRFAGLCGSQVADGVTGFVQDVRPGGIDAIISRFYVFNNGAADPQVFGGFSDTSGGGPLFSVDYSGTDIVFSSGAASATGAFTPGWNAVEISWTSGGAISLIINGGAEIAGVGTAATGGLAAVRLGNLNGAAGGSVVVDSYEAHLSTPVGILLNGDANGDGAVNALDLGVLVQEIITSGATLATGTPDANADGAVNALDLGVTVNTILGG